MITRKVYYVYKNKFQYCIYNHEGLELHELQKEYRKDKELGQNLSMKTNYFVLVVAKWT